jgi:hypothetical protein
MQEGIPVLVATGAKLNLIADKLGVDALNSVET